MYKEAHSFSEHCLPLCSPDICAYIAVAHSERHRKGNFVCNSIVHIRAMSAQSKLVFSSACASLKAITQESPIWDAMEK